MYSVVQVLEVKKDNFVRVGCSTEACQGCKAEMFCNNKNHTDYTALNPEKLSLNKGDWVEIFLPPGKTILSTSLVFGLPLILFPIGFVVSKAVFSLSEMASALAGIIAMGAAFCISAFISAKNKMALMPKITKIVK